MRYQCSVKNPPFIVLAFNPFPKVYKLSRKLRIYLVQTGWCYSGRGNITAFCRLYSEKTDTYVLRFLKELVETTAHLPTV